LKQFEKVSLYIGTIIGGHSVDSNIIYKLLISYYTFVRYCKTEGKERNRVGQYIKYLLTLRKSMI
jgi:hypothetical protein